MKNKSTIKTLSNQYYRIENAGGKVWLIPVKYQRNGLCLYQPSGWRGKLLKVLLPYFHLIPAVRKLAHVEVCNYELPENLRNMICGVIDKEEFIFSVFLGTPCTHQKTTIQIFDRSGIICYCKVTDSDEIARLFYDEKEILDYLQKKGVDGVPRCLFCGKIEESGYAFVQSTSKTFSSHVLHDWSMLHEDFLNELYGKTGRDVLFEDSDYYKSLLELRSHLDWLPNDDARKVVRVAVEGVIEQYVGKNVKYCVCHADFTPWNMSVEKGKLFVFDWEYAQKTYPPFLDKYHYFTQTAIFESHWSEKEILKYIESADGKWIDKNTYCMYLLDIISRYTLREKGNIGKDLECCFRIWLKLLSVCETPCMFSSF